MFVSHSEKLNYWGRKQNKVHQKSDQGPSVARHGQQEGIFGLLEVFYVV